MTIGEMIRAKVSSGDLLLDGLAKLYVGYDRNEICDGCERLIRPAQVLSKSLLSPT
jgi:hypothetical protein